MNIIAALLGGSNVYRPAEGDSHHRSRDWDGALIVARKIDIFTLVNEHKSALMAMLDIEHEEHPSFQVPSPEIARWNDFDAVRFAGFTNAGEEKSVKILSMESFSSPTNNTLNILSFKDKRVFDSSTPQGKIYHRVHQASRIEDSLCILHDQLVFKAETSFCAHGNDASLALFGPTADLLMSGVWIIGDATYGQSNPIKHPPMLAAVAGRHATVETMARFPRFSHAHRQWLSDRLLSLNFAIRIPARCECINSDSLFLYGSNHSVTSKIDSKVQCRERRLPPEYQSNKDVVKFLQGPIIQPSIFSSNSTNWTITLPPPKGTDSEAVSSSANAPILHSTSVQ